MKTTKLLSTALTGLLAVAPTLHAATIVKWGESGGDDTIVTNNNANGSFGTTYSTTYVSPADGTNGYDTGAAGQTREYYGAMDDASGVFGVNDAGGGDVIQMVRNFNAEAGLQSLESMIAWESPDFLTSDRVLESFTIEFQTRGGNGTTANYLIETTAGWYQSVQTLTDDDYTTISSAVGDLTWSSFSEFGVTGGGPTPADTDNIISVGAYFNSSINTTAGANAWTGTRLQYFEVTAVAIPEPSSSALLGLGGLAFALRRRRA